MLLCLAVSFCAIGLHRSYVERTAAIDASKRLRSLNYVALSVEDAEPGQRGYLLTGNIRTSFYNAAIPKISATLTTLTMTFAADATGSAGRLDHLQALVAEKLAELARTIALRQAGDIAGTLTVLRANEERHLLDEIRAEFAIFAEGAQARIARARRVTPIDLIARHRPASCWPVAPACRWASHIRDSGRPERSCSA